MKLQVRAQHTSGRANSVTQLSNPSCEFARCGNSGRREQLPKINIYLYVVVFFKNSKLSCHLYSHLLLSFPSLKLLISILFPVPLLAPSDIKFGDSCGNLKD